MRGGRVVKIQSIAHRLADEANYIRASAHGERACTSVRLPKILVLSSMLMLGDGQADKRRGERTKRTQERGGRRRRADHVYGQGVIEIQPYSSTII